MSTVASGGYDSGASFDLRLAAGNTKILGTPIKTKFCIETYKSELARLFSADASFVGPTVAEFETIPGTLEGVGQLSFDEYSRPLLQFKVEKMMAEDQTYQDCILPFIEAQVPIKEGGSTTFQLSGRMENRCKRVIFRPAEGEFEPDEVVGYGYSIGEDTRLNFSPTYLRFYRRSGNHPIYWLVPLLNFATEYPSAPRLLAEHPIRINRVPACVDSLFWEENRLKLLASQAKNRAIAFDFDGSSVFIEPLPEFVNKEKVEQLRGKPSVTALMVGTIDERKIDSADDVKSWFPADLLSVFAFCTGMEPGFPFIEFRDADGDLVERRHLNLGKPSGKSAREVFSMVHSNSGSGLEQFVSSYLGLPPDKKRYLRIAMSFAFSGSPGGATIEDSLASVVRGLEMLCREFRLSKQNLQAGLNPENLGEVTTIVKDAHSRLSALRKQSRGVGLLDQDRLIEKIQSRLANIATAETDFGLAVVDLAKRFGFPDPDILDQDYIPRKYAGRTWAALLSELRGAAVHEGYIEFEKKHNLHDVFRVLQHLHDLLVRIILIEAGYTGTYQTSLSLWAGSYEIDWVKSDFTAAQLGFED